MVFAYIVKIVVVLFYSLIYHLCSLVGQINLPNNLLQPTIPPQMIKLLTRLLNSWLSPTNPMLQYLRMFGHAHFWVFLHVDRGLRWLLAARCEATDSVEAGLQTWLNKVTQVINLAHPNISVLIIIFLFLNRILSKLILLLLPIIIDSIISHTTILFLFFFWLLFYFLIILHFTEWFLNFLSIRVLLVAELFL